jgi:molybdopterin/thiamine biosynthesis adenylyltransferase
MTTTRRETLARIYARADVDALGDMFVVSVGAGFVGSTIASELVKCGVGHIALVDGDHLEPANLVRHVLGEHYLWANKAEALADHLSTFPGVDVGALNRHIDASISDTELDALLHAADLIVIATDDNGAQRRVAARALALDIPTVIPSLYPEGGGEVFVGLGPGHPCQLCWDAFRRASADVRAVTAISADGLAVIQRTVFLCLAVLTPEGPEARDLAPTADDPRPRQVFIQRPGANLVRAPQSPGRLRNLRRRSVAAQRHDVAAPTRRRKCLPHRQHAPDRAGLVLHPADPGPSGGHGLHG